MVDLRKRFGRLVKAHRTRMGLTQEALAERANISTDMISKIEGGSSGARFGVIAQIADALEVDPAELFTPNLPTGQFQRAMLTELTSRLGVLGDSDAPKLRRLLIDLKSQSEIVIDEFSRDAVISTGFDENAAKAVTAKFSEFLEAHQDELAALTILYGKPHRARRLTYDSVDELRASLAKPPWLLEPLSIWGAYKRLSGGKITADPGRVLTDIVALVRYALGQSEALQPASADMAGRFNLWIGREEKAGRVYSADQRAWLEAIRDHVAANIDVSLRDLQEQPAFVDRGGVIAARRAFGDRLNIIIEELPETLVA